MMRPDDTVHRFPPPGGTPSDGLHPDQLGKLLTTLIREDRLNEGALAESFESGLIAAVAQRARMLSET